MRGWVCRMLSDGLTKGWKYWVPILLLVAEPCDLFAVTNGDFEHVPNRSWLRSDADGQRQEQGDRPAMAMGVKGNRYGHVGDGDGRGSDGENPSRLFQWFDLEDSTSIGGDCAVSFQFRTLLLPGELAWVRIRSAIRQRAWSIPNSNNQWAAIRASLHLPGGCEESRLFIDFGMIRREGGPIGGRLNVDEVRHQCVSSEGEPASSMSDEWDFLPPVPDPLDSEPVPQGQLSMVTVSEDGTVGVALLVLLSIVLFLWKLKR